MVSVITSQVVSTHTADTNDMAIIDTEENEEQTPTQMEEFIAEIGPFTEYEEDLISNDGFSQTEEEVHEEVDSRSITTEEAIIPKQQVPLACTICGAEFKQRHRLTDHMHRHENKDYICKVCGKSYKTPFALNRHSREHTAKSSFCDICGLEFKMRRSLIIHLRAHSTDKAFSCEVCGKLFKHKNNLSQHRKRHGGEKNHKCTLCDKSFFTVSYIK